MTDRDGRVAQALGSVEALLSYRRRNVCSRHPVRDVSLPQFHALTSLQELGPQTVTELAHHLNVSAPSASSIVDRMEEHGLVRRERDTVDRRVVHVSIADLGRATVEEMMGHKREHMTQILEAMTDEELDAVITGIDAVRRALDRLQPAADPELAVP